MRTEVSFDEWSPRDIRRFRLKVSGILNDGDDLQLAPDEENESPKHVKCH